MDIYIYIYIYPHLAATAPPLCNANTPPPLSLPGPSVPAALAGAVDSKGRVSAEAARAAANAAATGAHAPPCIL